MPEVEAFEAKLGELRKIRRFVRKVCKEEGQALIDRLLAVIDEAFTNIVSHGDTEEAIFISLTIERDQVIVELWDRGHPFDPSEVPIPDLDKGREDGMGLVILTEFVDTIAYSSKEGVKGWNRLQLFMGRVDGVASRNSE